MEDLFVIIIMSIICRSRDIVLIATSHLGNIDFEELPVYFVASFDGHIRHSFWPFQNNAIALQILYAIHVNYSSSTRLMSYCLPEFKETTGRTSLTFALASSNVMPKVSIMYAIAMAGERDLPPALRGTKINLNHCLNET